MGHAWQVLGNQVLMARIVPPDPEKAFTTQKLGRLDARGRRRFASTVTSAAAGLPLGLDSWDGYPESRERLYRLFRQTGARPLVVAGDSHCSWANELHDAEGPPRGL